MIGATLSIKRSSALHILQGVQERAICSVSTSTEVERTFNMSQETHSWSQFTDEKLVWRREDLQKGIDANPDEEQTLVRYAREIDEEIERRKSSK